MRTKYQIPVELKELDELLESSREDSIWEQKVSSKWVYLNLFCQLLIFGLFLYYYRDVFNILISSLFVLPACLLLYRSKTMKYSILPNEIKFEWGVFGSNKVSIPFSDITAINLVSYENTEYSTIFFGTNETYKIKKINFDENEPRAHITFENVKNGKKVNELLHMLWKRKRNKPER